MARLGELLVAAGLATPDQVQRGLRAQVMWGGRLGTNLVELGDLDLDALARTLARQHRIPAALERHFERADRALQRRMPSALAERLRAVPLLAVGGGQLAFAAVEPLPEAARREIAAALEVPPDRLVAAVAPELRIAYHLERVYGIPRDLRFLRPRTSVIPAFLHFDVEPIPPDSEPELVLRTGTLELAPAGSAAGSGARDAAAPPQGGAQPSASAGTGAEPPGRDDRGAGGAAGAGAPASAGARSSPAIDLGSLEGELELTLDEGADAEPETERRRYVRTLADSADDDRTPVGRISLRRVAVARGSGAAGATLVEAIRAIRRGLDRDRVADLVMDAIDRFLLSCDAALLLVKRGDVAIGWKGFSRAAAALPELGIPLESTADPGGEPPSLVARAIATGVSARGGCDPVGAVDEALGHALGQVRSPAGAVRPPPPAGDAPDAIASPAVALRSTEVAVVPIAISGQVMCALAVLVEAGSELVVAEAIAGAAGAAFARLIRDASR